MTVHGPTLGLICDMVPRIATAVFQDAQIDTVA